MTDPGRVDPGPVLPTVSRRRRVGAGLARIGSAGAAVAAAGMAVNALGYLTPVLGARQLSPADLSALATVLALGALASVPGLGLQAALAVRWARDGSAPRAGRAAVVTAAVTAAALVLTAPAITALLHLPIELPLLVAVSTAAGVLASRWLGELQGRQHFGALALGLVLMAIGRYGGIAAGVWLHAGVTGSISLGAAVAVLTLPLFALLARLPSRTPATSPPLPAATPPSLPLTSEVSTPELPIATADPRRASSSPDAARLGRDIVAAGGATLAMLAVSYADLILARHFLSPEESGAYAVGAVLTKGALWAPQVVTVLALPRLAQGSRRAMSAALLLVAGCGIALVLASFIGGGLAVELAGGGGYAHLSGYAAGFAAVGALYAVVFVLVNAEIAAGVRWPAVTLWLALAGLTTAVSLLGAPSLGGLLRISVITAGLATAAMAALALWRRWATSARAAGPVRD